MPFQWKLLHIITPPFILLQILDYLHCELYYKNYSIIQNYSQNIFQVYTLFCIYLEYFCVWIF